MLPDSALKSMKAMFATPCYISAVSMNYVTSIFDLTHHAQRFGLDHILHMHSESLITRGRNKMVIKFLEDESLTHLFWIDSDIAFRPQSVCRLLLADRDVCAAVYPMKSFNWPAGGLPQGMTRDEFEKRFGEFPYNPIDHGKAASKFVDSDGFVEVAEAPTGFMCIKRHVIYDMMKRYPELNYVPDGPPNNPKAHLHWLFFDCMVDPDSGRYLSEDYAFCRRCRQSASVRARLANSLFSQYPVPCRPLLRVSVRPYILDGHWTGKARWQGTFVIRGSTAGPPVKN